VADRVRQSVETIRSHPLLPDSFGATGFVLLGTEEAVVIGHTDCGMLTFTNSDVHEKLGPESKNDVRTGRIDPV